MPLVYQATNTVNGKRYIGVTVKSLTARISKHHASAFKYESPLRFHMALRKYGKDGFEWKILKVLDSYESAMAEEMRLVDEEKPEYNMTRGGRGGPMESFNKKKVICLEDGNIFDSMKDAAGSYGMTVSCISQTCAGHSRKAKGRHFAEYVGPMTEEQRKDMIKKLTDKQVYERSWESRYPDKNRSEQPQRIGNRDGLGRSVAGPMKAARSVLCLDDGKVYDSASAASRAYNASKSAVIEMCLGRSFRKSVKGLHFKYMEDVA